MRAAWYFALMFPVADVFGAPVTFGAARDEIEMATAQLDLPLASHDPIVSAALEVKADAIGMSGLLVKSTVVMKENLEEMNSRGAAEYPVLLGGAALTRAYVENDLNDTYDGEVHYARDAFEGLRLAGRKPWRVSSIVATADHNTPTTGWERGIDGIDLVVFEDAHQLAALDRALHEPVGEQHDAEAGAGAAQHRVGVVDGDWRA